MSNVWTWNSTQKLCSSTVCSPKVTFQRFESFCSISFSFKENLMQTHCFFKSAIFFVYQNGHWNNTLILQKPLLSSHMLQLYSKQEMTKQSLLHLHAAIEVGASSSSVISHSVQKLFVCITYVLGKMDKKKKKCILSACRGKCTAWHMHKEISHPFSGIPYKGRTGMPYVVTTFVCDLCLHSSPVFQ